MAKSSSRRTNAKASAPKGPDRADPDISPDAPAAFFNRELSWLAFARRVLAQVEDAGLPLLERVKFAGIVGMLHSEFFAKRMSGLKRQMRRKPEKRSVDGRTPAEEYEACRTEIAIQTAALAEVVNEALLPALAEAGFGILRHESLARTQQRDLRAYFEESVLPILTPLAVDAEHPFPFISSLGLNLAVQVADTESGRERFVRIKVPANRPRWVPVPGGRGFVPIEQVIAANLDLLFGGVAPRTVSCFRVTRGAEGEPQPDPDLPEEEGAREPGSIVRLVSRELKARRFAGVVRLEVEAGMPKRLRRWLGRQLGVDGRDVYLTTTLPVLSDLLSLRPEASDDLRYPPHVPCTPSRLAGPASHDAGALFEEIARGDLLLHHPYHSFDASVLRFLEAAAADPQVLGLKLTIYRTSRDSPIVAALAEAAREGKQVAVLVEITARFDEAPNIAWGRYLEQEGVHVSYGVESLKTHVKLALVVREEEGRIRRYAHLGTGNYHSGTARVYEDVGLLTADPEICADVSAVFNGLTGATPLAGHRRVLVAPVTLRERITALIRREAEHARAGRPCGIHAKMNQLQDAGIIRELYEAGRAGVPILLNVRGLCCLRPGVAGLSENIRVFGVVGRFLEHSRIFRFENAGAPEHFIGSADWMRRNLDRRVETVTPVLDEDAKRELDEILRAYVEDNASAWDCGPDGVYRRRRPAPEAAPIRAQEALARRAGRRGCRSPASTPAPQPAPGEAASG